MPPIVYIHEYSPPCRAVMLTAAAIELEMDYKHVNPFRKEQLCEEFLKCNPQHTIPTLNDNGIIICDSHAIITYLVSKYGPENSPLYPKDLVKRAMIDQRLYYDASVMFPLLRQIVLPLYKKTSKEVTKEKLEEISQMYKILEKFLDGQQWIAGDTLSVADLSCIALVSSFQVFVEVNEKNYPNINNWMRKCESLPYYHFNNGVIMYREMLKSLINQI